MKYVDLRQAMKNCVDEARFNAFITYNVTYKPFGNFYGLCKIIAEETFLFCANQFESKDLNVIRDCLLEIRQNGFVEFEDKKEYL